MLKAILIYALVWTISGCLILPTTAQVRSYLSVYEEANLSAGAVLLAQVDTISFHGGLGYADLESRRANSDALRFRIGSITKSMTRASVACTPQP